MRFLNGKSASEVFQKPAGAGFSDEEIAALVAADSEGTTWKPTGEEIKVPPLRTWTSADGKAEAAYDLGHPPEMIFDTPAFEGVLDKERGH